MRMESFYHPMPLVMLTVFKGELCVEKELNHKDYYENSKEKGFKCAVCV